MEAQAAAPASGQVKIADRNRFAQSMCVLFVDQLDIEIRFKHVLDVCFLRASKIDVGENLLLFEELPLVKVFDRLTVLLLIVD